MGWTDGRTHLCAWVLTVMMRISSRRSCSFSGADFYFSLGLWVYLAVALTSQGPEMNLVLTRGGVVANFSGGGDRRHVARAHTPVPVGWKCNGMMFWMEGWTTSTRR